MKITTLDWRTRVLTKDDGTELGRIRRVSWFGHTAEVMTVGQIYLLKTHAFRQKLTLLFNETPVLEVTFPWRSGADVKILAEPNASFTVRQESIWRSVFVLNDKVGQPIASFRLTTNWKKFRQEAQLNAPDDLVSICPPWVLLSSVHAVMVRQSRRAAAAS